MLSSLLRTKKGRRRPTEHSPFSSPYGTTQANPEEQSSPLLLSRPSRPIRHASADFTETEDSITHSDEDRNGGRGEEDEEQDDEFNEDDDNREEGEEDGEDEDIPLLPIFSAAHLGRCLVLQASS